MFDIYEGPVEPWERAEAALFSPTPACRRRSPRRTSPRHRPSPARC
jgi:hypothetical protein